MNLSAVGNFHQLSDHELIRWPRGPRVVETHTSEDVVLQERQVNYRFHLHQHPYVHDLMKRLIRKGTRGLQDADTDFESGRRSLPESLEVEVPPGRGIKLPKDMRVVLDADVSATDAAGVPFDLGRGMSFALNAEAVGSAAGMFKATLVLGMSATPNDGATLPLSANSAAVLFTNTPIVLGAATEIRLYDGKMATIPANTPVIAGPGTMALLAAGDVTLRKSKQLPVLFAEIFSATRYAPTALVSHPYPVKDLDFTTSGAYGVYNWELFFHTPITIAMHLSKNQRFAEAQQWFHFLFDPTDDSDGPTPERFWKVRPFQYTDVKKVEEILVNLSTGADPDLLKETVQSIEAWKDAPFRPHVIARYRQQAYMYKTVMAYLDNLIAWGDSLFRQDTGEAIDEAMMLYVLAANILGQRPQAVPKKGAIRTETYASLRKDLKELGTALRDLEPELGFDNMPMPTEGESLSERLVTVQSLGKGLYFGVPRNEKLLGYWDTVTDRLFKIRNSLNFQGVFRQLALFEPPIDPAMLARAAAAGLDVGAIMNGLNQPLPLVRFQLLVQKANELCQEVKSLGSNLLSAMEKEDGEAMQILRSKHERAVLELVEHVRYAQLQEAIKSKEGLVQSLASAVQRYVYYERQLGKKADEIENAIPDIGDLDKESMDRMRLMAKEKAVELRELEVDIDSDLGASGGRIVNRFEAEELEKSEAAREIHDVVKGLNLLAQGLSLIPEFGIDIQFWGLGGDSTVAGGSKLSQVARLGANIAMAYSDRLNYEAGRAAKIGGYARREQDWAFQSNLAAGEINQMHKQLRAAQIREAIAELELKNHRQQMKHAAEIEQFLNEEGTEKKGKKTNKALYTWMKREVKGMYAQCFQFAFDFAKKAERALQHELGDPQLSYVQYGYLAGKEGLLAGERLYLDIKRMEMAYLELNQREYEITKHISVLQLDPLAMVKLRTTGSCTISLPESLFDMDGPGHYFRRIKTVAVSIPCVTGPYAGVNCTLTLTRSTVRTSASIGDGYERTDAEDPRFSDYLGRVQSIVTSSGQNDSGLFETNLRDERYLPFENAGAISEWRLQLPGDPLKKDPLQFDYGTISDAILHVRYTAREGGDPLRGAAKSALKTAIESDEGKGNVRLFSVRQEFPTEWAKFKNADMTGGKRAELAIKLLAEHYPYWTQGRLAGVARVDILARGSAAAVANVDVFDKANDVGGPSKKESLVKLPLDGLLHGQLASKPDTIALPDSPMGELKLYFSDKALDDIWLALQWTGA